jgi:hypothetical protein
MHPSVVIFSFHQALQGPRSSQQARVSTRLGTGRLSSGAVAAGLRSASADETGHVAVKLKARCYGFN